VPTIGHDLIYRILTAEHLKLFLHLAWYECWQPLWTSGYATWFTPGVQPAWLIITSLMTS